MTSTGPFNRESTRVVARAEACADGLTTDDMTNVRVWWALEWRSPSRHRVRLDRPTSPVSGLSCRALTPASRSWDISTSGRAGWPHRRGSHNDFGVGDVRASSPRDKGSPAKSSVLSGWKVAASAQRNKRSNLE